MWGRWPRFPTSIKSNWLKLQQLIISVNGVHFSNTIVTMVSCIEAFMIDLYCMLFASCLNVYIQKLIFTIKADISYFVIRKCMRFERRVFVTNKTAALCICSVAACVCAS